MSAWELQHVSSVPMVGDMESREKEMGKKKNLLGEKKDDPTLKYIYDP